MNILAVIPARYGSSRMPGKPLENICGKPMIWWVFKTACEVKCLDNIVVQQMIIEYIRSVRSY